MRKCPECGDDHFSVTWMHCEIFNRFFEEDGKVFLSENDEDSFEAAEKVIECRNCGWVAPTTEEEEFIRWLKGDLFFDVFDHLGYLGGEAID